MVGAGFAGCNETNIPVAYLKVGGGGQGSNTAISPTGGAILDRQWW